MSKHAAVTIVSKNYFAYAKTLAESYKRHHPENDFIIVLVDKADGYVPASLPCGAEIVELGDVAIPDISRFIYRYSIMELNTAVKPFALADFFQKRNYETLLYIDPDILVFRPLTAIYEALESASIVLTPHMRKPFYDDAMPSDVSILQSGTYNLGFIGLKNSSSATQLLDWWMTKLYRDCIVDIPNGLFVDQKWMDLVPGFFPDHKIIYDPGYNAAYWNLHERTLTHSEDGWRVDGESLSFFHFSGYIPFAPQSLSKHQNRHQLESMKDLKALTDEYGRRLLDNGYDESSSWPYAFERLANGVRLPLGIVRNIMQWASRSGINTPCPVTDADGFCCFLMSKSVLPNRPKLVLLFHFLLQLRGDVVSAYPNAQSDHADPGFRTWLKNSGEKDYGLKQLAEYEDRNQIPNLVAEVFDALRKGGRADLLDKYRAMWRDTEVFDEFVTWLGGHGIKQLRLTREHARAVRAAAPGPGKILNIYFLRGDLQAHFPVLWDQSQIGAFANWLMENRYQLDLTTGEITIFAEFCLAENKLVEKMRFLYQHKGAKARATPNIYSIDARRYEVASAISTEEVLSFLCNESTQEPVDQFLVKFEGDPSRIDDFDKCAVPGLDSRKNFAYYKSIEAGLERRARPGIKINFAGYLLAESGMGEAGRSVRETLAAANLEFREMLIPHPKAKYSAPPASAEIFGWPMSCADATITVANADTAPLLEAFLPRSYWGKKNVGYWLWETEQLPMRFEKSADLFDEIWASSKYTAEAIAKTVTVPVRVLPLTLDFAAIEVARPNRAKFGLPENALLFGFIFDPQSVIERKNVAGLVRAFQKAFSADDNCYLVLKANGRSQGAYDYEMIRASVDSQRVLFIEATFSRSETFDFIKSLDAYVSLHRAEGFGLTCAEAMALELPVIASQYSGNLEFMDTTNSLLVPTKVIRTSRPYGPYPVGTCWGDPDIDAAADMMRSLRSESRRREIGKRGSESVRSTLRHSKVAGIASALLKDLQARDDVDH